MCEYHQPSNELFDARIVMSEGFGELQDLGILFCYKADDRIRQEYGEKVKTLEVIDKTGVVRKKRHPKNC